MKVLGFAVIALGLIVAYIAITGSQHRVMGIILHKNPVKSGKTINPSGTGNIQNVAKEGSGGNVISKGPSGGQFT